MGNNLEGFKDSKKLTDWVRYFLYLQIAIALLSLISGYMEFRMLSDFQNGVYESQDQAVADAESSDARQAVVAIIYLVNYIVSGVFILKWIYRANYNARQLGAVNMKFTPGWSVGWYFVPLFSLWKPYQAMEEIWKASHNPGNWATEKINYLLPLWWGLWLAANFLGQAVFRLSMQAEEVEELLHVNVLYQLSDIVNIPLAMVTLALVNSIYRAQVAQPKVTA